MSCAPSFLASGPHEDRSAQQAAQEPIAAEGMDRPVDQIRAELFRLQNQTSNWGQAVLILVVSLGIFVILGLFRQPVVDLMILVVVLFIHELGHYLGMRLFEYRNVRMFFIPLFGAAVSGRRTDVEGYKEAIVALLGPVPGLIVGFALLAVWVAVGGAVFRATAMFLIIINGFNLLPLFPLDGGRFLQVTLFARNPYLESIVQGLAGLAMLAMGIYVSAWILGLLGAFVLIGCPATLKTGKIAVALRPRWGGAVTGEPHEMPDLLLVEIMTSIRREFQQIRAPRPTANLVMSIWDKLRTRLPDWGQTIALLFIYGFFLVAVFVVPVLLLAVRAAMAGQ